MHMWMGNGSSTGIHMGRQAGVGASRLVMPANVCEVLLMRRRRRQARQVVGRWNWAHSKQTRLK